MSISLNDRLPGTKYGSLTFVQYLSLIHIYRSEQHDLAAKYPEKVAEMSKAYEAWAKRCMVEPYPGQKKK